MTPFALRLCFFDPKREADKGYGGERATFIVAANDLGHALPQWMARAKERGVALHIVEEARAVASGEFPELVSDANKGAITATQSYGYPPLEPASGVAFGWIADGKVWQEFAVKYTHMTDALQLLLEACVDAGRGLTMIEGMCDVAHAEDTATFAGKALNLAALEVSMNGTGNVVFGDAYAIEEGQNG